MTAQLPFHEDVTTRFDAVVSDLGAIAFSTLTDDDLEALLGTCTSMVDRINHATARVARAADERQLGDRVGARHTAHWWASQTRMTRGEAGRRMNLARNLAEAVHAPVSDALAEGALRTDQAEVIISAVNDLPEDLEAPMVDKARDHLLDLASEHDAHELRILGKRVLEVIDPQRFEDEEQKRLEAEEARAAATARITLTNDGHGKVHGRFSLPALHGELLRSQLMALADPRRDKDSKSDTGDKDKKRNGPLVTAERLGQAFMELIEALPAHLLPTHAASSVAMTVTIDFDKLTQGLGVATLANGQPTSASEARRLACRAGILPAVLNGNSEVLDLGRTKRLFTAAQFKALTVRDKGCTVERCGMPASICHAHHDETWSAGGKTDLNNGRLICPQHHRMVHNPRYESEKLASGKLRIIRRT